MSNRKQNIKRILGGLPLTAEIDWYLRHHGEAVRGFSLERLEEVLDTWVSQAAASPYREEDGKRVFIFGTQRYWIDHAVLLGLALAGLGHKVTFAYLPFADWRKPVDEFDLRQHALYARKVLAGTEPLVHSVSLLDYQQMDALPPELALAVDGVSLRDVQYTQQQEDVDKKGALYKLRRKRNQQAARGALAWMQEHKPDVVILPNGSIMEFGAIYEVAQYLSLPTVTYEFGEQRERVWLSQQNPVMLQETDAMWAARKDLTFTEAQYEQIKELFAVRQGAGLFQNFYRRWQNLPAEGEDQVRAKLGLDERPIVLLATNVIGDSLTLGRQAFTDSMTEWLKRTVAYFASKPEAQFVVRIHPGELQMQAGPSVAEVVDEVLPEVPKNIHVIAPGDEVNTYDLVAIADLGMVYTTTVGMEMAMSGVPVIVVGKTHYRGKGFTLDPSSWNEYLDLLDSALADLSTVQMSKEQVDTAWHYAYRFFFDYPRPFPWHLVHLWNAVAEWPLARVLSEEGLTQYRQTFQYLTGKTLDWTQVD
ncbi:MAG: hypothetical protein JXB38_07800 [Anaerolineales bacterium]|nr:hypothetical protein [Anaerolineales bacterium]